jgi:predicted nucleotidyltransferase
MASTPISDITATIQLVKRLRESLEGLVDVVEKLAVRVEKLEEKLEQEKSRRS